jgi:hypothetical protein
VTASCRPDIAALACNKAGFDVRQPNMIGPAVGVQRRRMAASVIAAKDPHFTDAGFAQFAENVIFCG